MRASAASVRSIRPSAMAAGACCVTTRSPFSKERG